ncbi:MAG: DUF885 domain-containing protein [Candidatus Limnocylindrales bacterium]
MTTPVYQFADRAWLEFLELNPLWATVEGVDTWDDRLDDPSAAGRAALMSVVDRWAASIDELSKGDLSTEDTATLGLMRAVVRRLRGAHELRLWQLEALDQIDGPQSLTGSLARFHRTDTPERFENLLKRLAAYPGWVAAHQANVAEGVAVGRTAPAPVVERCIAQTRELLEIPVARSPLMAASTDLPEEQRATLLAAVERDVLPPLHAWLETLEEYAGHVRAGDGVCHLPDGEAVYRHAIRSYTNLDEEPGAIHEYGLARLDEIEMAESSIARELGHESVGALRAFLDRDPENHAASPEEMVELVEAWVRRAELEAPKWFGNPPTERCVVQAVEAHAEKSAPAGFYYAPASDGSRPGIYFLNTYDPSSRPLHQVVPMTFHEAVPGHHFQLTAERHLDGLPAFRVHGALLACGAYVEGWALYSERLSAEMGLYHTSLERFGAWESEAHRAARLVVDTGLHAFGWTRQQSIDLLRERAGLSQLEAEIETDRYLAWPGQALSYMIGQREIMDLRAQLEERDGERFDHRAFHDAVIGHGSLPLDVLREQLPGWVRPKPA